MKFRVLGSRKGPDRICEYSKRALQNFVGSPPGGRGKIIYSVVPPLVLDSKSPSNFALEGMEGSEIFSSL
jgi:hypothetical protein